MESKFPAKSNVIVPLVVMGLPEAMVRLELEEDRATDVTEPSPASAVVLIVMVLPELVTEVDPLPAKVMIPNRSLIDRTNGARPGACVPGMMSQAQSTV